jgi:hypothetical protein
MPGQFVPKPNFNRGSMGRDISQNGGGSPVPGPVIDRNQREAIQNFSKDAHFKFTAHPNPTRSTHDTLYNSKDNSNLPGFKKDAADRQRVMKAAHFDIGAKDGNMLHPKPAPPIDPPALLGEAISIEEAKKRLTQASWTVGQSPMKYESIQKHSFVTPGKDMDK